MVLPSEEDQASEEFQPLDAEQLNTYNILKAAIYPEPDAGESRTKELNMTLSAHLTPTTPHVTLAQNLGQMTAEATSGAEHTPLPREIRTPAEARAEDVGFVQEPNSIINEATGQGAYINEKRKSPSPVTREDEPFVRKEPKSHSCVAADLYGDRAIVKREPVSPSAVTELVIGLQTEPRSHVKLASSAPVPSSVRVYDLTKDKLGVKQEVDLYDLTEDKPEIKQEERAPRGLQTKLRSHVGLASSAPVPSSIKVYDLTKDGLGVKQEADIYDLTEDKLEIKREEKAPRGLLNLSQISSFVDLTADSDESSGEALFVPNLPVQNNQSYIGEHMVQVLKKSGENHRLADLKRKRLVSPNRKLKKQKAARKDGRPNHKIGKIRKTTKRLEVPIIGIDEEIQSYDPIAAQNDEPDVGEAPSIEATTKKKQLQDMLAGCPEGSNKPQNHRDKAAIERASRGFGGRRVFAVNGAWRVDEMHTRKFPLVFKREYISMTSYIALYHHQLIGSAWMYGRETNDDDGPRGGILADAMGLGKTLQIIAVSPKPTR